MLKIQLAKTKEEKDQCNELVENYHSYVGTSRVVGRCLKYMIFYEDELIGTFWLGSGFKPTPKSILNYFGRTQKEYDDIFNMVADNKRFCMKKQIYNLGTQILKQIRKRAKQDWFDYYKDELIAIITTVGNGKTGAVYLADNWEKIGETSGLPKDRKSVSMKWDSKEVINERFVKPTGEDKKVILITMKI